jgi:hypothetical protein
VNASIVHVARRPYNRTSSDPDCRARGFRGFAICHFDRWNGRERADVGNTIMAAQHSTRPISLPLIDQRTWSLWTHQREIEASARARLQDARYAKLRHVSCEFHEGILTLRGRVSSYYMKQIAQAVVQHLSGVERLVNRVEVLHNPESP